MMTRVLVVPEAGDAWPSGLVKGLIYKDLFARHGLQAQFLNRRSAAIEKLASSGEPLVRALNAMGMPYLLGKLNRLIGIASEKRIIAMARRFDVVYLLKTDSNALVAGLRRATKARLVFDLNDGLWLPRFSRFAGGRLTDILRDVDAVISDNEYGVAFARQYNDEVYMVPDHPQVELFDAQRHKIKKNPDEVVLGWVGSPRTMFNLFSIWEPLEKLFARHQHIRLRLVGAGYNPLMLPRFERVRYSTLPYYSQNEMVSEVLGMDIGLFPLFDIEDSYARGILKATIYMSGGIAVVCSAIGACNRLICDRVNGMLAHSPDEWFEKLDMLVTQPELRQKIAQGGLEVIRSNYTIEHSFDRLRRALLGK